MIMVQSWSGNSSFFKDGLHYNFVGVLAKKEIKMSDSHPPVTNNQAEIRIHLLVQQVRSNTNS